MARKSGEDRKNEIIAIARDLIFNEGFGNFTIRAVAGRIGISEAAIYRHFSSKEELLLGLLDTLFIPWRQALEKVLNTEKSVSVRLQSLVELHLHHLVDRQLNPVLFFSEAVRPENEKVMAKLAGNLKFLHATLLQIVEDGRKLGELPEDVDPEAAAACMVGILQSSVIKWTLQRQASGLVEYASGLMDFFLCQITAKRC